MNKLPNKKIKLIHFSLWSILLGFSAIALVTPALAKLPSAVIENSSNLSVANRPNLLEQGKAAYEAGRYVKADEIWQQAYRQAEERDNIIEQAISLNYLSLNNHKLGNLPQAEQYISQSVQLLERHTLEEKNLPILARVLNTRGRILLAMGKAEAALESWQQAAKVYQQVGDEVGMLGSQINQVQAWQSLGLYRRSQKTLQQIGDRLKAQANLKLKLTALRSLGITLQVTGDLERAREVLHQSLAISQKLNLPEETSTTLFSLGNTARALNERESAIAFYLQAATTTSQPLLKTEALLNQLSLLIATDRWQQIKTLLPQIQTNVTNLSSTPSRRSIYANVNFAKNLIDLAAKPGIREHTTAIDELLTTAIAQARQLKDIQAESYASGILGYFYKRQQQWSLSKKYTERALQLAEVVNDSNLSYQWQWQLGRLLAVKDNNYGAIAAYSEAVKELESLRSDLILTNNNLQFSFSESVEPVYRQLVSLLLKPQQNLAVSQERLIQARNTIEALRLAELNNFFREACLETEPKSIENIDPQAAVIYPIILSDRLEVIISLPGKPLRHYSQQISQAKLETVIEELRQTVQIRSRRKFYQPAQQLYDWIIRPALKDFAENNIKTLVFVPDGSLRNIPPSMFHDGDRFLIEQYSVALTSGLHLLAPIPLKTTKMRTLAAGITLQRRGFYGLEYVNNELENIREQTNSVVLKNEEFTKNTLREKIESSRFKVVHIATHGQFSSNLEDTFLLAWDDNINIKELEEILQQPEVDRRSVELLILSACETATGDKQAALGIAGMAVKAGAKTTLATLWSVYDESTAVAMNNFYRQLTNSENKTNKALTLRQTQLAMINSSRFTHPFYWSGFIMLGNWL
ncbi:CHAT domain-containing protein [Myxosarcina sp. GI1]|uniref:CHAT domain-containing protein n=1 Tax=Myxosarcina sp. GI1 TaxID=1541065 RepID=UPI00055E8C4F|nr:CHAT domain-containing protein [Myxosarcina sp. GI1]